MPALFGLIYWKKVKDNILLKWFVILLWYTALNEHVASYYGNYISEEKNNILFYTVKGLLSYIFYFILFLTALKRRASKIVISVLFGTYLMVSVIEFTQTNILLEDQTFSEYTGSVLLIIAILYYFVELIVYQGIVNLKENILVYISSGLLLFEVGMIPIGIARTIFLDQRGPFWQPLTIYQGIIILLMNLLFTAGFIWGRKKSEI
ncbi:hypothetical protein [Croceiramulus getboli]|nr:hypothetical protein P8624_03490 [Flavobacteriaceae bacterium YJPT1-3]